MTVIHRSCKPDKGFRATHGAQNYIMRPPLTFIRFEIQQRRHSPNVVVGITEVGTSIFVAAPGTALGKEHGDQLALQIKAMLEREYLDTGTHGEAISGSFNKQIADELELLSCPGDHIKETIEELGIDVELFVIKMQMSNTDAGRLLKGLMPITSEIALRLETITNVDAQFWLNLEANYREKLAALTKVNNNVLDKPKM